MSHLDAIDNLRGGIGLRGYAQKDPLVEYKNEAFRMFEQLFFAIDDEIVHRIYKIHVDHARPDAADSDQHMNLPKSQQHTHIHVNTPESEVSNDTKEASKTQTMADRKVTTVKTNISASGDVANTVTESSKKKLGRNDPCWCGSGKKWKKCHYPATSA